MAMKARAYEKPAVNQSGFVRTVVIENKRHVQFGRDIGLHRILHLTKLVDQVKLVPLSNELPRLHIRRRKQRGGAMAAIIMPTHFHLLSRVQR